MAVRLRVSGIVKEIQEVVILAGLVKMLQKLAAVIRLYMADGERRHAGKLIKEIPDVEGRIRLISIGESEAGLDVYGRKQVAFNTADKEGNGILLHQVSRLAG
jgi:hypothetical protein